MDTHFEHVIKVTAPYMAWARGVVAEHGIESLWQVPSGNAAKYIAVQNAVFEAIMPDTETMEEALLGQGNDAVRAFYMLVSNMLSKGDANALFAEIWQQRQHQRNGRKVYEVSAGLAEQLKFTHFGNVKVDALKLPFKNIYIQVPHNAGLDYQPQYGGSMETVRVPVVGIYLTETTGKSAKDLAEMKSGDQFRKSFASHADKPFKSVVHPTLDNRNFRVWRTLVIGEAAPTRDLAKSGVRDFTTFSFDLFLIDGMDIEDLVRNKRKEIAALPDDVRAIYEEDSGIAPTWENLTRWIFNVVAYATMPDAEVDHGWDNKEARQLRDRIAKLNPGNKKDDLKARLKALDPQYRIYLGRKIFKLDVQKRMEGLSAEGRKLVWRLLVSGHWKHQAYGVGRLERKLIWIQPYWKGPADAPTVHPRHTLTEAHAEEVKP
jgi:hypothetical protein